MNSMICNRKLDSSVKAHDSIVNSSRMNANHSTQSVSSQLFTMPSFTFRPKPTDYTLYLTVHRSTGAIVAFGKFFYPTTANDLSTANFSVIRLNEILSPGLIEFLKTMLIPTNEFLMLPIEIPFESIQRAPNSVDDLIEFLMTANWLSLLHWFLEHENLTHYFKFIVSSICYLELFRTNSIIHA